MDPIQLAAVLAAVVVLASMISVELGISVALLELGLGVVVGNLFHIDASTPWLTFVASFASIVLTFLAGAEVDPDDFRQRFGGRSRSVSSRSSGRSWSRGCSRGRCWAGR